MARQKRALQSVEQAVWDALRTVFDPELGASLVDLNMIRSVTVSGNRARIELTLTAPGCPLAWWLEAQVREAALAVRGIQEVEVRILQEPWEPPGAADWRRWLDDAVETTGE